MRDALVVIGALGLFGSGWALGSSADPRPDFMLSIDAPVGETRVECVSGCTLIGANDVRNPSAGRMKTYVYSCQGPSVKRCSASAGGWMSGREP